MPNKIGVLFSSIGSVGEWLQDRMQGKYYKPSSEQILQQAREEAADALGISPLSITFRYSQSAGCKMCPCSPGYYIYTSETNDLIQNLSLIVSMDREDGVYEALAMWASETGLDTVKLKGQELKVVHDVPKAPPSSPTQLDILKTYKDESGTNYVHRDDKQQLACTCDDYKKAKMCRHIRDYKKQIK